MKKFILLIIVIAVAIGGVYVYVNYFKSADEEPDEIEWVTYTNDEFDFKIDHPENWKVLDFSTNEIAPIINIVKETETKSGPFIHHDDVTQVSIFPNGYPTEGVFGETKDSNAELKEPVRAANDYIFEDGTPWATFLVFRDSPPSWGESGFVWASLELQNAEEACKRDGITISMDTCDPFFGDTIVRHGNVSQEDRDIELRMIESFEFTEESVHQNLIRVFSPLENSIISSPLSVNGEARGQWYFEATFPVTLVDWDGKIIAETHATALGDWMTEEFVPFEATVEFESPAFPGTDVSHFSRRGTLILHKDNPSGLPEYDDAIEIPIRFE